MATRIFPSENDVHDVTGSGRKPTEANLTLLRNTAAPQISHYRNPLGEEKVDAGGIITGFDFSAGTSTSVTLTAGTATIEGFAIEETTTIVGVLTANMFNYVFLTLDKSSGLVTDISLTVRPVAAFSSAVTIPVDSILIWCFETDGAAIITQFDFRTAGTNVLTGSYTGNGAATRTFDIGFRPKMVHVYRNEDATMVAQSPLAVPRGTGMQRGVFSGIPLAGHPMVHEFTNDPELVPIIVENGFTVEDGPGAIPGPVFISASKTFQPPGLPLGDILGDSIASTTFALVGAKVGDLAIAQHQSVTGVKTATCDAIVTAPDVVTGRILNTSGVTVNLASGKFNVGVFATAIVLPSLNELNKFYFFIAWF